MNIFLRQFQHVASVPYNNSLSSDTNRFLVQAEIELHIFYSTIKNTHIKLSILHYILFKYYFFPFFQYAFKSSSLFQYYLKFHKYMNIFLRQFQHMASVSYNSSLSSDINQFLVQAEIKLQIFYSTIKTLHKLRVSLVQLFEMGFLKKWGFQKVWYEIELF